MGTIAAKPKPAGRTNRVEQEILRCAAIGETADFTTAKWSRVKRIDGRPVVSGKFLADLWLGMEAVRVHPIGIWIKGLHVEGELSLGGARVDGQLRTPLVGFMAEACRFETGLALSNARLESLYFSDCEIGADEQFGVSLFGNSLEVIGQLHFTRCSFEGFCSLRNAVIDDDVAVTDCGLEKGFVASGAEIRGNLLVKGSRLGGVRSDVMIALELFDTEIGGNLEIAKCRMKGGISAGQLKVSSLTVQQVTTSGPTGVLSLPFAHISHNLKIFRSKFSNRVNLAGVSIGGEFLCARTVMGDKASQIFGLSLASARVAMLTHIEFSRIHRGISAEGFDSGQRLRLSRMSLAAAQPNLILADFSHLVAGKVEIADCFVSGQMRFDNASLVRFAMENTTIAMAGRARRKAAAQGPDVAAFGLTFYSAKIEQDLVISGNQQGGALFIDGGISMQALRAGGQVVVRNCWIGCETMGHSVQAWGMKAAGAIEFSQCVMPAGFYGPNLETADLRLKCGIMSAPTTGQAQFAAISIQAARIGDSCYLGSDDAAPGMLLQLSGTIHAVDCKVGNTITVSGLTLRHPNDRCPELWAGGLSFAGAQLGDVQLGGEDDTAPPTTITGCIAFDRAKCRSVRVHKRLSVNARRKSNEQSFAHSASDDILRCKWGVTLSLVGTTIERGLVIDRPAFDGIVDCKNLSVNLIVDNASKAWSQSGILPGQLRLDGVTYDDLNDDQQASAETRQEGGSTAHPKGAVARRLDWLAMQYPGGMPDAASFAPQPYEQLARHYAAMGDERARRQVLVRKRQIQRLHSGLGWIERAVSGLLGLTSDYGYSPGKASAATLILVLLGTIAAWGLYTAGAIVPAIAEQGSASFSPLLYAIDVAVPFLDLGHDGDWNIDPGKLDHWPGQTLVLGLAEALYRFAGLVMLSITVLTFSGILHEKE